MSAAAVDRSMEGRVVLITGGSHGIGRQVAPAVVRTDFSRVLYQGRESEVAARYPLGRLGESTDVAAAGVFLLSPAASWIPGTVMILDGGLQVAAGAM
ncbi:MAG TPA: SDR family oxidoreductase [Verrucomicrobiae bacterium]|nr:SDR family oxidoreductase [Verrucomicrobiae bacterium]